MCVCVCLLGWVGGRVRLRVQHFPKFFIFFLFDVVVVVVVVCVCVCVCLSWQTNWDQVYETFDSMDLREELQRGIYAYG